MTEFIQSLVLLDSACFAFWVVPAVLPQTVRLVRRLQYQFTRSRVTSQNREMSATMVRPRDKNAKRNAGESCWLQLKETTLRLTKDQVPWLHLRPSQWRSNRGLGAAGPGRYLLGAGKLL